MLRGHGGRAELVASFVLVLGLVLWGRARCLRCNYISDTIPMLPYPGVVLVAVLGAALFYRGMVRGAPRHAPAATLPLSEIRSPIDMFVSLFCFAQW